MVFLRKKTKKEMSFSNVISLIKRSLPQAKSILFKRITLTIFVFVLVAS